MRQLKPAGLFTAMLTGVLILVVSMLPLSRAFASPRKSVTVLAAPKLLQETGTPTITLQTPLTTTLSSASVAGNTKKGTLVVADFYESGKIPETAATALIFSNGTMVNTGELNNGVYGVTLPVGNYDVVLIYHSTPQQAYLFKDMSVKDAKPTPTLFMLPLEGKLEVTVEAKNGKPAQNAFSVRVTSGGEEVTKVTKSIYYPATPVLLRTNLTYSLTLDYPNLELTQTGITLQPDQTRKVNFRLPYDEGSLNVVLVGSHDTPLPDVAKVSVIDPSGKTVAASTYAKNTFKTILPAATTYTVSVQYKTQPIQEKAVRISADTGITQTFTFTSP